MAGSTEARRKPKWHLVYFALAAFDLLTISGSLYLNHEIMGIYANSVAVNQELAEVQGRFMDLGRRASAVNAPGNDVFRSGNVDGEMASRDRALGRFEQSISGLRTKILENVGADEAAPLLDGLVEIETAMDAMLVEENLIFSYFREDRTAEAGRRMATMDRKYAGVAKAVARANDFVRGLQLRNFDEQIAAASLLRRFEYLMAGVIALIIAMVAVYGTMMAKKMKQADEEKAAYLAALAKKEEALQQRVGELSAAKEHLEQQGDRLRELAERLYIARDRADTANRAKSEFLATMSHELRTPLNAVIGFSEMMMTETLGPIGSPKYREYADCINAAGEHLLALINDILDLSKVESGMDELHQVDITVPDVVESALRLVRQRAEHGGLGLEPEMPADLPRLHADERKLKQILVNLLSNAVKFTNPGGKVMLRATCHASTGHVFQIIDTGIGIAIEDTARALSLFGQVDGEIDRRYEGTGLGLPLTKRLVEMHGGHMHLQSEVGVGTTVTVRFPARRIVRAS